MKLSKNELKKCYKQKQKRQQRLPCVVFRSFLFSPSFGLHFHPIQLLALVEEFLLLLGLDTACGRLIYSLSLSLLLDWIYRSHPLRSLAQSFLPRLGSTRIPHVPSNYCSEASFQCFEPPWLSIGVVLLLL